MMRPERTSWAQEKELLATFAAIIQAIPTVHKGQHGVLHVTTKTAMN